MVDNITAFPGGTALPDNPMQLAPPHSGWCSHTSIIIDQHSRTVTCADPKCGAVLDPFGYLVSNAKSIGVAWSNYSHVMRQANEVAERVTVLKKEEQRLRAMVKRLQEKTGAVVSVRGREL